MSTIEIAQKSWIEMEFECRNEIESVKGVLSVVKLSW